MVGIAQLVEHLVVVQGAAGSSPVTHPNSFEWGARIAPQSGQVIAYAGGVPIESGDLGSVRSRLSARGQWRA